MTPQQKNLRDEIAKCEKSVHEGTKRLAELVGRCKKHVFEPLTKEQQEDEWLSITGKCLVCGQSLGWRCKKSPTGVCEYHFSNGEDCIHCGMPDERK